MARLLVLDVGATNIKWAAVEVEKEGFKILEQGSYPTAKDCLESFMKDAKGLIDTVGRMDGIALSILGTVLPGPDGLIEQGGNLPYMTGVKLAKELREASLGLPVSIENDGRCAVLGEYAAGGLRGCSYGFGMVLGTGVGGGIILDGRLLRGAHSFAGEIGYCSINQELMPELEAVSGIRSSYSGLLAAAEELWKPAVLEGAASSESIPDDTYKLFAMAGSDDPSSLNRELARSAIRRYARELAVLIWNIQCTLDPERISIGGGVSTQPLLKEYLGSELSRLYDEFPYQIPKAELAFSGLGNDANIFGAAYNWIMNFGK